MTKRSLLSRCPSYLILTGPSQSTDHVHYAVQTGRDKNVSDTNNEPIYLH